MTSIVDERRRLREQGHTPTAGAAPMSEIPDHHRVAVIATAILNGEPEGMRHQVVACVLYMHRNGPKATDWVALPRKEREPYYALTAELFDAYA